MQLEELILAIDHNMTVEEDFSTFDPTFYASIYTMLDEPSSYRGFGKSILLWNRMEEVHATVTEEGL